jgi:hypothetical protein
VSEEENAKYKILKVTSPLRSKQIIHMHMALGYDDDDDDDVGCNTIRPNMLVTRPCSTAMS